MNGTIKGRLRFRPNSRAVVIIDKYIIHVTLAEDPQVTNDNSDINNTKEIRDGSVTLKTVSTLIA